MYEAYIREALEPRGAVSSRDPDQFLSEHSEELEDVKWRPNYVFLCGEGIWGVSIFSGDRVPNLRITEMVKARAEIPNLWPAFFVPEDRDLDLLLEPCSERGIAVIGKIGEKYRVGNTTIDFAAGQQIERRLRIPLTLTECCKQISRLAKPFVEIIGQFSEQHRTLAQEGSLTDDEEVLVKDTFAKLLGADKRFCVGTKPIELLRQLEILCRQQGFRDHFFHTFQNFLLGCIVIEKVGDHFKGCLASDFPSHQDVSVEYIWLLTALFHDIGYSIQRKAEWDAEIFGITEAMDPLTGVPAGGIPEPLMMQLTQAWESPVYQSACNQLVQLFVHLSSGRQEDWKRDWRFKEQHPFRDALRDNFLGARHAVASCFRLLVEVFPQRRQIIESEKELVESRAIHAFLAAISIPFHDAAFREALRKSGIQNIKTSQFPFGALLAFIDSIQDDRRELATPDAGKDILEGLCVENGTVRAYLDVSRFSRSQILNKRKQATDILDFLTCDGLAYEYPKELMG